jgi:hypothetical protein
MLQGLPDPAGAGHQRQRSPAGAKPRAAAHQGAQAGRVQETGAAQVRDDVNGAVTGQVENPLADLRGGARVDLAVHPQHGTIAARGDGLQLKGLHAASGAGLVGPGVLASATVNGAPVPLVLQATSGHRAAPGGRACPGVTSHRADQPGRAVPGHIATSSCCASRQITDHVDEESDGGPRGVTDQPRLPA